jgi:organic hydroperoxide reductase OsmC/OhrA
MTDFVATIKWQLNDGDFLNNNYSRAHSWEFDGGTVVAATASPHIVSPLWAPEENVDPEEAFVASLASCHMLFFLAIAAKEGIQVESYEDNPFGTLGKNQQGKHAISRIVLRPSARYAENMTPSREQQESLHHQAHEHCFLANSVNTQIDIEIQD